jgi:hypothetical protein
MGNDRHTPSAVAETGRLRVYLEPTTDRFEPSKAQCLRALRESRRGDSNPGPLHYE